MNIPVDWATGEAVAFLLVVARLSGLFLLAPVFSSPMIPVQIKVLALLGLALAMTPIVAADPTQVPTEAFAVMLALVKETIIGLALGFAVAIVFAAIQVAASMIDTSIGFAMANVIDPLSNSQASVFGSFYSMVATLAFLAVNGHHWMIEGFVRSFKLVSISQMPQFDKILQGTQDIFFQLFMMAFQIAAPVLVTLLLVDVVLGIVARVVPQMNVFFVGIPLKIGIGMLAIIIALPTFTGFFEQRLSDIVTGASVIARAADPGQGR